jgi:lysine 6-dehydrogenase
MKILVLGGAGSMGMVTTRDLAESRNVSKVIVCDVSKERLEQVAKWVGSEKLSTKKLDASNHRSLVDVMKKVDAVANALPYHLNLRIMKAAMKAKKNLTDLGGVYHTTRKQLKLGNAAKKAGITVVLGCGLAPGTADIFAIYRANKLDQVNQVHIRYADKNLEPAKYKWAFRTVLEEYTKGPVVYRNGRFERLPPFSGKQVYKFPEPLGECTCCYGLYSGVATLPSTINKGVKIVDCAMSCREEDEQRIKVLTEMGLTETKSIEIESITISPREFLLRVAPPPDVKVKDVAGIIVEVTGEKSGKMIAYRYSLVQQYHIEYGVSATAYLTGVPLSIAAQALAKGQITAKGVLPPEKALPINQFIRESAKRGIKIQEKAEAVKTIGE